MNEAIDDELREYVHAFKAIERPTAAAHAATWANIEATIEATIATTPATPPRTTPWLLLALAAGVALCIGLAAAVPRRDPTIVHDQAIYHPTPAPAQSTPPTPRTPSRPIPDAPDEPPVDEPPTIEPPTIEPPTIEQSPQPLAPPPASTAPRSAPKRRPAPPSPSLRPAEVASFRTAQAALADDDNAAALQLLDDHGRRFPGGVFEEERQVSRAVALCKLGRQPEARALRDDFLNTHPASHLGDRMRHSCRDDE